MGHDYRKLAIVLVHDEGGGIVRFGEADGDGSKQLIAHKVNRDLVSQQFGVKREVSHDAMAGNSIEPTQKANAISPPRHRLLVTCCNNRRPDYHNRDGLEVLAGCVFELLDQKFLGHSLRVAIGVGEPLDDCGGLIDDILVVGGHDLFVVNCPVMVRGVAHSFI
jgi:hypothetical protein